MPTPDNETIVRMMFDDFNNRNLNRAVTHVAQNAVWLDVPSGATFRGPEGQKQFLQNTLTTFPDTKVEITNLFAIGEYVVVEYMGRGTNSGPLTGHFGQMPATGRRIEMMFCNVVHIKNGEIVDGRCYYDIATMLRQLGLLPMARQAGA